MAAEKQVSGRVSSPGALTALRRVVVDFDGPYRSEHPATFLDFRFELSLTHVDSGQTLRAPGFFAADGRAGETGAASGGVWRVVFAPPREGVWRYRAHFRFGPDIALSPPQDDPSGFGEAVAPIDGMAGALDVGKPGRPGETPEGSADLGGAGPLREEERALLFPAISLARPLRALEEWRDLLGCDAFDDPARNEAQEPLSPAAALGAQAAEGGAPYSGALRLVETMAETAARRGAGLVRLDLFPAALGDQAAGPWRRRMQPDGSQIDPLSIDVSRIDQWEALLERMAARGLAVELNLDPPNEAEASAFWSASQTLSARRLLLRELSARFSGFGSVIWRGGLTAEDQDFAAALDPNRAVADWRVATKAADPEDMTAQERVEAAPAEREEEAPPGPVGDGAEPAAALDAATPPEPSAVATRPPPEEPASPPEPASTPAPPETPAEGGTFFESAGAAAATAVRSLSGLLQDVVAPIERNEAVERNAPQEQVQSGQVSDKKAEESEASGAFSDSNSPPQDELARSEIENESAGDGALEPPQEAAPAPAPAPAPVSAAEAPVVLAPPPRLRAADLAQSFGETEIELMLYRLDATAPAPEAEPLAMPAEAGECIDLSTFSSGETNLIIRLAGSGAASVGKMRLWLRRLRSASDPATPAAPEADPQRVGPILLENADPFALFSDLGFLAQESAEGPAQLVLEALAAEEQGEEPRVLRAWSWPVARAGGVSAALAALPAEASSVPEGATSGALEPDLDAKIRNAPQMEERATSARAEEPSDADADADGAEAQETLEASQGAGKSERPVFFGALVSEARRKAAQRKSGGVQNGASAAASVSDRDETGVEAKTNAETLDADEAAPAQEAAPADNQPERVPSAAVALGGSAYPGLTLRRLELIDGETDRRVAALREGSFLDPAALLGKRITVKATLAGVRAAEVMRLRMTLEGEELSQRAVDRPQPGEEECVGMFYGLIFHEGEAGLLIEAMGEDGAGQEPLLVARRRFSVG